MAFVSAWDSFRSRTLHAFKRFTPDKKATEKANKLFKLLVQKQEGNDVRRLLDAVDSQIKNRVIRSLIDLSLEKGKLGIIRDIHSAGEIWCYESAGLPFLLDDGKVDRIRDVIPAALKAEQLFKFLVKNEIGDIDEMLREMNRTDRSLVIHYLLSLSFEKGEVGIVRTLHSDVKIPDRGSFYFRLAVKYGDVNVAELMLREREWINQIERWNPCASTPLHIAVGTGNHEMARFLIKKKADVNLWDKDCWFGRPPLYSAVKMDDVPMAELLLLEGAEVNPEICSDTLLFSQPLHLAVEEGNHKMAALLLKNHAEIECQDGENRTALYISVERGDIEMAELLLMYNANAQASSLFKTALEVAVERKYVEMAELLIKHGADLYREKIIIDSALDRMNISVINTLGMLHFDFNTIGSCGFTFLHKVEGLASSELVPLLVEYGADINIRGEHHKTPLHVAVIRGDSSAVVSLVKHGADISLMDEHNYTSLDYAFLYRQCETAGICVEFATELCLQESDNLNSPKQPVCPFDLSASPPSDEIMSEYDLTCPSFANSFGWSPLHCAAFTGNLCGGLSIIWQQSSLESLENQLPETPLHIAAGAGYAPFVYALLYLQVVDIDAVDQNGATALHHAALGGHLDASRLLLYYGIDHMITNEAEMTACHIARWQGDSLLIALFGDQDLQPEQEETPVFYLSHAKMNQLTDKIKNYVMNSPKNPLKKV